MAVNASATAGEHSGSGHFFPPKNHQCQDAQLKKLLISYYDIIFHRFTVDIVMCQFVVSVICTYSESYKNVEQMNNYFLWVMIIATALILPTQQTHLDTLYTGYSQRLLVK